MPVELFRPRDTRRTFFWLSTSWEKAMSREELSTSLGNDLVMGFLHDGLPESLSLGPHPVTKRSAALSL